jgi:hypothetical protein
VSGQGLTTKHNKIKQIRIQKSQCLLPKHILAKPREYDQLSDAINNNRYQKNPQRWQRYPKKALVDLEESYKQVPKVQEYVET